MWLAANLSNNRGKSAGRWAESKILDGRKQIRWRRLAGELWSRDVI
jgi:hypothetical protein